MSSGPAMPFRGWPTALRGSTGSATPAIVARTTCGIFWHFNGKSGSQADWAIGLKEVGMLNHLGSSNGMLRQAGSKLAVGSPSGLCSQRQ